MKNLFTALLTLFALSSTQALAEIHPIQHMQEILPYLSPGTLVVFDIDNTILEPRQTLGSNQWFEYLVRKAGSAEKAVGIWEQVQLNTDVQAVEASTPALVRSIQSAAFKVIALTARPPSLEARTRAQLASVGIGMSAIVAIGPQSSKGEALVAYLARTGLRPARVVFVDDKVKHVQSVDSALGRLGVDNHEFRYGAADLRVAAFDSSIAEIEQSYFEAYGMLLPDEQARRLLNVNAE